jgi:PAS domain S-box-containing protein
LTGGNAPNEFYQSILEAIPNGIIIIDNNGIINMLNGAACSFLAITRDVVGRPIKKIFTGGELTKINKGQFQAGEKIVINGHSFFINRSDITFDNCNLGAVIILQDATEIEEISKNLNSVKKLNQELDAIFESSFDGIMIGDEKGNGVKFNRSLVRITGLEPWHFLGRIADLEENGIFLCESVTLKGLREKRTVTAIQKVFNGKEVFCTANPIIDSDGKASGVVTNVRDLTELNQLKEELEKSNLLATRYHAELSELMYEKLKKEKIIAESPGMRKVFSLIIRAARTDSTIMILGESGVGKEVLARIIHKTSNRSEKGSFIQINCGAIPENLLESELFGYEAGAFTGANPKGKAGLFEIADNGTLLLDEIGDLSLNLQVKLLRVLQEREFYRIGSTIVRKLDIRIISATNVNIWEKVQTGSFREDLYYRLNVLPIEVPPLRERKEDILPLAVHFVRLLNEKYEFEKRIAPESFSILESYSWPGNVRELQNVLERLWILSDGDLIEPDNVDLQLNNLKSRQKNPSVFVSELLPMKEAKERLEKELIKMAFDCCPSVRKAARILDMDHAGLIRKAEKYGITLSGNKNFM